MKRLLLVFTLAAAVLAVPATASAFSGVALAKKPARDAVVIASRGGVVRTVRATPERLGSIRVGQRLVFSAPAALRRHVQGGLAPRQRAGPRRAPLRGIVVHHRGSSYLISAGGSVLARPGPARGFSSRAAGHRAGDRVEVRVQDRPARPRGAARSTKVGHAGTLELEGIFLGIDRPGSSASRSSTAARCSSPSRPASSCRSSRPGDEIELIVIGRRRRAPSRSCQRPAGRRGRRRRRGHRRGQRQGRG